MPMELLNIPLIETPFCILNLSKVTHPHVNCLPEYCINREDPNFLNDRICINDRTREFLIPKNRIYSRLLKDQEVMKDFGKFVKNKSDWKYFEETIKKVKDPACKIDERLFYEEVRNVFAYSDIYRLRYKIHGDAGQEFVKRIFSRLKSFCTNRGSMWGTNVDKLSEYEGLFTRLCTDCETKSSGGIYRLYDLIQGVKYKDKFPEFFCLCLLFAFGHGDSAEPKLESISQLVAKFQFFEQFVKYEYDNEKQILEPQLHRLASEEVGEIIYRLWYSFQQVTKIIMERNSSLIIDNVNTLKTIDTQIFDNNNELLPRQLACLVKREFTRPLEKIKPTPIVWYQLSRCLESSNNNVKKYLKLPHFRTWLEAAYHPFKHLDIVDIFYGRSPSNLPSISDFKSWSREKDYLEFAFNSVNNYVQVIWDVMNECTDVSAQPSQFDWGTNFKFEVKRKVCTTNGIKTKSIKVFVRGFLQSTSYLLTCF